MNLPNYSIVREFHLNKKSFILFDNFLKKELERFDNVEHALLALFDYSGWTGNYIIHYCDDIETHMNALSKLNVEQ